MRQEGGRPTVWARVASRMLDFSQARGADRGALLAAAGLEEASLRDADARVPLEALYALVEEAVRRTGEACWGLHLATGLQVEDFDALGFLMESSPTLGAALRQALRYQRLWNDGERYSLRREGASVVVGYHPYGPPRPAHPQLAQLFLADLLVNGGRMVGGLEGARVRLREARPAQAPEYERVLGVAPDFGAPEDALVLPASALERPLLSANEALHRFFERYTEGLLRQLPEAPSGLAEHVRARLAELLPEGQVGVAAVARRLRMSPRTLQRRLREEGTSVQAELEALRRQRAGALLDTGMAIAEVAWLLGYSEPAAFHHAFKRWTGTTPDAWRARAREG